MLTNLIAAIVGFIAAGIDGLVFAFDCTHTADRQPLKHIVRVSQRQSGAWYAYRNVHRVRYTNGKATGDYGAERVATSPDAPTLAALKPWLNATAELMALTVGEGATLRTTYGKRGNGGTVAADGIAAQVAALKAAQAAHQAAHQAEQPAAQAEAASQPAAQPAKGNAQPAKGK